MNADSQSGSRSAPHAHLGKLDLLPAIDLRQGKVVRLRQGDDTQRTVYGEDPRQVLGDFAAAGARWVHLVDLDAAFGESPQRPLLDSLINTAKEHDLQVELGGGLRDRESVLWALEAGVTRGIVGSLVAKNFPLFESLVQEFPGRLVPGLDLKNGRLGVDGWTTTVELDFPRLQGLPCPAVLVTDIQRDGEMGGPNLELACSMARVTGIPALLSGGVHSLDDLRQAALQPEISGAVVGRALYEGRFSLQEALAASC
ncbi:MAG: 1-(5-phosphoribosyl)-5-[(5-phosphoribosylamino)methylideneamino] imidazole-4-carboxamide isomerase [Deltaproteobacteria bacterium]|nr:1-(5-phosphoribosyl)-5-[(5-phosphoribosylamino)methylideneamino] imidazole-4-carboxamide isomerase [Deltaproteobacteria bacterium]